MSSEAYPVEREVVATAKDGVEVYLNPSHTNMHLHILENPEIIELAREVIESSHLSGDNIAIEKDLGRIVGTTNCVLTDDSDEIVYAKRKQRDSYSRFVKNRAPEATQSVVVIINKVSDDFELWSAWCGSLCRWFEMKMVDFMGIVVFGLSMHWCMSQILFNQTH